MSRQPSAGAILHLWGSMLLLCVNAKTGLGFIRTCSGDAPVVSQGPQKVIRSDRHGMDKQSVHAKETTMVNMHHLLGVHLVSLARERLPLLHVLCSMTWYTAY